MKKTRYCEEQIVNILKEGEAGISVNELCRKYGMSDATYYNWKAKYAGMAASDVKRLKQLEDENSRLKHLVADLTLDNRRSKKSSQKTSKAQSEERSRGIHHRKLWAEPAACKRPHRVMQEYGAVSA
jgi:putative transposase